MSKNIKYLEPESAAVLGLGYVGLPTAALLASSGIRTIGIDINEAHIESLKSGSHKSNEPGLTSLLRDSQASKKLSYTGEVTSCDAYIIAVPTPINVDKTPGMEHVLDAVGQIAKVLKPGQLVVLESTSPPGATKLVAARVGQLRPDLDVSGLGISSVKFAYCPERVLPGNALKEIVTNERLVGGISQESSEMAAELYRNFTIGNILICEASEAEMAKLVENSFRDVNIAFANEVARIADKLEIQADVVISLANRHPRVNILDPGIGVGGHCISVDPWFLVHAAPEESAIIRQARIVNDAQPFKISSDILELLTVTSCHRVIFLGLSYKPDSDDLRESPALKIVRSVFSKNPNISVITVEPNLPLEKLSQLGDEYGELRNQIPEFCSTDLVIELVSHKQFKDLRQVVENFISIPSFGQLPPEFKN
jgi:UDP-N-acetyl-D-mannosaminuronic acid dehydrogenase